MRIAITGGTGFAGRHLARHLILNGHEVVLLARGNDTRDEEVRRLQGIRFKQASVTDRETLELAFEGCDAVAHLAGINRELGDQTYQRIHVEGTQNVVSACRTAGVRKVLLLSFLRARPNCGSAYHESKFAAEEIVRTCGIDFSIIKAGMTYGRGDHMIDHLSHSFHTIPLIAAVGLREKPVRPLFVEDLVQLMKASLTDGRLSRKTVAAIGPEQLFMSDAFRKVASVIGKRIGIIPAPIWFHYGLSWVLERTMKIPLIAIAQVRILSEGLMEPSGECDPLPEDLQPQSPFGETQIRKSLPEPRSFGLSDLRCCLKDS